MSGRLAFTVITSNDRNLRKLSSCYSLFKIWKLYAVTYYKSFWKCTLIFLTANNVLMDTVGAICQYYTSRFHQVFYVGENSTMVTLTSYFIRIQPCHLSFHINVNKFPLNTTLRNISEVWPTLITHNFSNFVHAWIITPRYTTADIPLVGLFTHLPTTPMLRTRTTPHIYLIKY